MGCFQDWWLFKMRTLDSWQTWELDLKNDVFYLVEAERNFDFWTSNPFYFWQFLLEVLVKKLVQPSFFVLVSAFIVYFDSVSSWIPWCQKMSSSSLDYEAVKNRCRLWNKCKCLYSFFSIFYFSIALEDYYNFYEHIFLYIVIWFDRKFRWGDFFFLLYLWHFSFQTGGRMVTLCTEVILKKIL